MTCAVIGPGLVGTFLGALAGADRVICRWEAWDGPRQVRRPADGRIVTWRPEMTAGPGSRPCLVATRVPDTPRRLVPADALLAQNGLGQPGRVMACFMAIDRDGRGVFRAAGGRARLVMSDPGPDWRPVLENWRSAGLTVEVVADPLPARWEKCILNATVGPLCLATGRGMRAVWDDPDLRDVIERTTHEGLAIARAEGVTCDPSLPDRARAFFDACGDHLPSVVSDPRELPWVLGHLERARRRVDLDCPGLLRIREMAAAVVPAELLAWPGVDGGGA